MPLNLTNDITAWSPPALQHHITLATVWQVMAKPGWLVLDLPIKTWLPSHLRIAMLHIWWLMV
jgi:hypothetical protein